MKNLNDILAGKTIVSVEAFEDVVGDTGYQFKTDDGCVIKFYGGADSPDSVIWSADTDLDWFKGDSSQELNND